LPTNNNSYPEYIFKIPDYDSVASKEDCYFDSESAQLAIDFFAEHLVFIEGEKAGQAFILEEWQKAIIGNLVGWKRPDGTRRYREALILVPRKNGKTPLVAGIVNLIAYTDGEAGAQIYSSAGEREQAALTFRHASGMIVRNSELSKRAKIYKTFKSIEYYEGDVVYKALSADADTKHGLNAHLVINDELHIHKDRDLIDTLQTATGSRKQPLIISISTAGWNKDSICYEKYDYACKVRDGIIKDKSFLPVIYEIKESDYDNWDKEEVWKKCNPNLGVSIQLDYLKEQCQKAKDTPAYLNTFLRLHLNKWTQQETLWLDMAKVEKCCMLEPSKDKTLSWYGGLDMSSSQDLTAFSLVAVDSDGYFHNHCFPFIPKDCALLKERQDKVPYTLWNKDGYVYYTEGNIIDHAYIRDFIINLRDKEGWNIKEIAIDTYNAQQIAVELQGAGFEVVPYGQGIKSINSPAKKFEQLILSEKIKFGNNPLYKWSCSLVEVKMDENENVKPVKGKAKKRKRIDPVLSTLMALGRLISNDIEDGKKAQSIYSYGTFDLYDD